MKGTSGGHEPKQMPAGSVVVLFPSVGIYFSQRGRRSEFPGGFKDNGHSHECQHMEV